MRLSGVIRKVTEISLVCLMLGSMLSALPSTVRAATIIYVPDDHSTIQTAVDAASPGDTIIVRDATCTENVDVNKNHLTIRSKNGAEATIVQAANSDDHVFEVTSDNVVIQGFTTIGATDEWEAGIYLASGTENCTISNNRCGYDSDHKNYFGIYLDGSSNNTISGNTATNNISYGIYLNGSSNNTICKNMANSNNSHGIYLYCPSYGSSNSNIISGNTANSNYWHGILLVRSSGNTVYGNTASSNNNYGIRLGLSSNNILYLNNFSDNILSNVYCVNSTNMWNSPEEITYTYNGNTYTSYLGNYWSDYTGSDADGDCIGDMPYSINLDKDNYPLFGLFENSEVELGESTPPEVEWDKTFGGADDDYGASVKQTSDGGYIIAGITSSYGAGNDDVWLIKTDSSGNRVWDKTFGGINDDWGVSVEPTSDGGYIIAGETWSYGAGYVDVWLIKTDSSGNRVWDKTFGGTNYDRGHSVKQTSDGGYIIAGYTASYGVGIADVWLIKTDSSGNKVWDKTFGGTGSDIGIGKSVEQTSDGGYIIVGETWRDKPGKRNVCLIKTDSSGNKVWDKTFGGTSADVGYSVKQTSDGGYIIAGDTSSYGAGSYDVWLIKTDSSGNRLWDKTFGGTSTDCGYSVKQTSDGGYIIAGDTSSYGAGDNDVWLIKTDSSGNKVWDKTFGGINDDWGVSVDQTSDGGYIIAGATRSYGAGNCDVWLIKVVAQAPTDNPPIISSVSPKENARGVAITTEIHVTFSEAMDRDWAESAFSISPSVSGTFNWDGNKMIFTPDNRLRGGTTYTVTISKTARDLDGNSMENSFMWSFTTCTRPVVLVHGFQCDLGDPASTSFEPVDLWTRMAETLTENSIVNKQLVSDSDHTWYKLGSQGADTFTVYISNYTHDTNSPTFCDIRLYAQNLSEEIERVKEDTGYDKVDIVAHSMGGLVTRAYIENSDFSNNPYGTSYQHDIIKLIMLGTPNHGVFAGVIDDLGITDDVLRAWLGSDKISNLSPKQMIRGSKFLNILNCGSADCRGNDRISSEVDYTTIAGDFYKCSLFFAGVLEAFRCALFHHEDNDGLVCSGSVRLSGIELYTCDVIHSALREDEEVCENVKRILLSQPIFFEQPHTFAFACPVHVTITDEHGRVTSDTGANDIPGAAVSVDEINEVTIFYLPPNLTYAININGYDTGDFTLIEQLPVTNEYTLINIFQDVPTTAEMEATLEIVPGETGRVLEIDHDGNGTVDEEKGPDASRIVSTSPPKGMNWWLIISIVGAIVVAGSVTYLLIKRRRKV